MARTKTNTQNNTKTRITPRRNKHLEQKPNFLCVLRTQDIRHKQKRGYCEMSKML